MAKVWHFISRQFILQLFREISLDFFCRAHWCPPCRNFTPKLAEIFKGMTDEMKGKLEIVFVSYDRNQSDFEEYFKEMPWKALPFSGMSHYALSVHQ